MDPIEYIEHHRENKQKNIRKKLIKLVIFIAIVAVIIVVLKFVFAKPTKVVVEANGNKVNTIVGNYNWKFLFFNSSKEDASLGEADYKTDNILQVKSGDEIHIYNILRKNIKNIDVSYYNIDLGEYNLKSEEINAEGRNIFINAKEEIGTYNYKIVIDYQDGNVAQYNVKVIVDQDIDNLKQYSNCTDVSMIEKLVKDLPYGKYAEKIEKTDNLLNIKYSNVTCGEDNLIFNNIVLFTYVSNLDTVHYICNNAEFEVTKSSIQNISDLSEDAIKMYKDNRTVIKVAVKNNDNKEFKGTIQSIDEKNMTVKVDELDEIKKTSDLIAVPVDENKTFQIGDKVKVVYQGDVLETYPAQIYLVDIEKIDSDDLDIELSTIPVQYTKEQAISDGYYIYTNTGREYNENKFEDFVNNVKNSKDATIRIISFTSSGNLIITDINYMGGKFNIVVDSRRDTSLNEQDRTYKQELYQYFGSAKVEEYENKVATIQNKRWLTTHKSMQYYLYN